MRLRGRGISFLTEQLASSYCEIALTASGQVQMRSVSRLKQVRAWRLYSRLLSLINLYYPMKISDAEICGQMRCMFDGSA